VGRWKGEAYYTRSFVLLAIDTTRAEEEETRTWRARARADEGRGEGRGAGGKGSAPVGLQTCCPSLRGDGGRVVDRCVDRLVDSAMKEQKEKKKSIDTIQMLSSHERTCVFIPLENISHGMAPTMPTVPRSRPHIFPTRQHGVWADANPPKPGNSRTPQPVRAQTPTAHPSTTSKRVSKFPRPTKRYRCFFVWAHPPRERFTNSPAHNSPVPVGGEAAGGTRL